MRKILILSGGRTGDLQQMERVAKALGWPTSVLTLRFTKVSNMAIALKPLRYLESGSVAEIVAANADVVMCAEASTGVVALRAKKAGGQFKLVCIGRPRGHFGSFDLILSSPQYKLWPASNIVELPAPPHDIEPLSETDRLLADSIRDDRRSVIAAFVGGSSPPDLLDVRAAQKFADVLNALASEHAVHAVMSPRTAPEVVSELKARLSPLVSIHVWPPESGSYYRALLYVADRFVVTSDSVSMTAEALLTGKKVRLHRLPQKSSHWHSILQWLHELPIAALLFSTGILETRPNRIQLFNTWSELYGLALHPQPCDRRDFPATATIAAGYIRRLFSEGSR